MKTTILKILILFLISGIFSCSTPERVACTDVFVLIHLTVIDDEGHAADSVNILVYRKRDNKIYDLRDMNEPGGFLSQRGIYTVFHDGFLEQVKGKNERIVVRGEKRNARFSTEFQVGGDECHIYKISGPDTISLNPSEDGK